MIKKYNSINDQEIINILKEASKEYNFDYNQAYEELKNKYEEIYKKYEKDIKEGNPIAIQTIQNLPTSLLYEIISQYIPEPTPSEKIQMDKNILQLFKYISVNPKYKYVKDFITNKTIKVTFALVPSADKRIPKSAQNAKTAGAYPNGLIVFNREFAYKLIQYGKLLKELGYIQRPPYPYYAKDKNNKDGIGWEYGYIDLIIQHEFLHIIYGDHYLSRYNKDFNHQMQNILGDYIINNTLVEVGKLPQLPIGLFQDYFTYKNFKKITDMQEEFAKWYKKLGNDAKDDLNEMQQESDDHFNEEYDEKEEQNQNNNNQNKGNNNQDNKNDKNNDNQSDESGEDGEDNQDNKNNDNQDGKGNENNKDNQSGENGEDSQDSQDSQNTKDNQDNQNSQSNSTTRDDIPTWDEIAKEIEKAIKDNQDKSLNDLNKEIQEQRQKDIENIKKQQEIEKQIREKLRNMQDGNVKVDIYQPRFSWEALLKKMIPKQAYKKDETYKRLNKRTLEAMATGEEAVVKAGIANVLSPEQSLIIVVDTSASMTTVINKIFGFLQKVLIKSLKEKKIKDLIIIKFDDKALGYKVNVQNSKLYAYDINNLYDIKNAKIEYDKKAKTPLKRVLETHLGGGTTFSGGLTKFLKTLLIDGYNIAMFTDTDILWENNIENVKQLMRLGNKKPFSFNLFLDDKSSYKYAVNKLGKKSYKYMTYIIDD